MPADARLQELPAHIARHVSPDTQYFRAAGPFVLESGETLERLDIAYQTWGDPANAAEHTILVCHALTGSADVDAWWPGIIGSDGAFDPAADFIVCANIPGSCYGSSGPLSFDPATGERYRAGFPRLTVRDMVRAEKLLLDHLGVRELELVTGPSLGGMQALEWAALYPDCVHGIAPIGCGVGHSAWCIGSSEAQRAAIAADPNWKGGWYDDDAPPAAGLAAARMMAVCGYRSWDSFELRFGRERRDAETFEVQSYLRHQGEKINDRFDANCYVALTLAMHSHDLAAGRADIDSVLAGITQRALVVSVSSDGLYPPAEQQRLADGLPNARYAVLETVHGHDGFLIETGALAALIRDFRAGDDATSHSGIPPARAAGVA